MSGNKLFFPNLNGLRFVAALLVIISHFYDSRIKFNLSHVDNDSIFYGFGELGVTIFFVLSGFLITTLLLHERKSTGSISLKNFYARRIFRIWPLYFLIVILCFFVIPHISALKIPGLDMIQNHFGLSFFFFCLILPAFAMHSFGNIPFATITWSIGVEEIFYLISPLFIKYSKHLLTTFILFAIAFLFLGNNFVTNPNNNKYLSVLILFLVDLRLTTLAIGAIGAILYFRYPEKITRLILNRPIQLLSYLVIILVFSGIIESPYFNNEIFALFMCLAILNLALNKKSILRLTHPVLEYLGKISYGIYMYHLLPIFFFTRLFPMANMYLLFCLCLLTTIAIAALSYHTMEKYFLRLKSRF